ncbi:MAG: CPBP family intramembrane metalloprotease [Candidatus Brockarchaeota archaeon]|nr:CPBP family intramembrane metalloprotease [Candidatus Brockarchaeota archaeon]
MLSKAGVAYYFDQRVFELSLIVLASSVIPLLLVRNQIKEFNGFRKALSAEQLTFLLTALIVIPSVLMLDRSSYLTYEILILPLLEEWFFRGLLLPTLATINTPVAIAISSLMFSLTHYFRYEPVAFFLILILGTMSAIYQAYYRSIFLPMSMHILWNWYVSYKDSILYGSGLTYFGGLALGVSYAFGWLVRKIWEHMQSEMG